MRVEAGKKLVAYMGDDRRGATPGNLSAPVPSVHPPARKTVLYLRMVSCTSPVTI